MTDPPIAPSSESYDYGRWQEIKSLFGRALSIPPGEREAWLDQACGADAALQHGVRKLIADYRSAPQFVGPGDDDTQGLPIGTVLAERFAIERQIGRGGMGEVYEVLDKTLGERFALKTLRRDVGSETDFTSRFRRELLLARQITHSNVCRVSEFHETVNPAGRPLSFFTMELLVGETLAQRLVKGKLTKQQALTVLRQVAAGLDEVHRLGTIHRDLKPANIMLVKNADGSERVVLMDFGLARSGRPGSVSETRTGMPMGTPAYMAPEQFTNGVVTAACDIYALGVTLLEMLTRHNHPLYCSRAKSPELDQSCEEIIARCLDVDPLKRPASASDVVAALDAPSRRVQRMRQPALKILAAVLAVGGLLVSVWFYRAPLIRRQPVITKLSFERGLALDPAATPDGKLMVYASDRGERGDLNIWLERTGSGEATQLTDDRGNEDQPAISRDGRLVAYHAQREGMLYLKTVGGGAARPLAKWGRNPQFSPDGSQIAYWTGQEGEIGNSTGKIWLVPVSGDLPRQLAADFWEARYPVWSPNGKQILFEGVRSKGSNTLEKRELWLTPLEGNDVVSTGLVDLLNVNHLRLHDSSVAWNGERVVFAARAGHTTNLWQLGLSARQRRISGNPERLTTSTDVELTPAMLADGRVIYTSWRQNLDVWRISIRSGTFSQVTDGDSSNTLPTVSRDGRRLLYGKRLGETRDIWLKDLLTQVEHRLIPNQLTMAWISPDGGRAAYSAQDTVAIMDIDSKHQTVSSSNCGEVIGWFPDNSAVLYRNDSQAGNSVIGELDSVRGSRRTILSMSGLHDAAVSPDKKSLAFTVQQSGVGSRIYLKRLRGSTSEAPVAVTEAGFWSDHPAWSHDGTTLFYTSERDGFRCIWSQRVDPVRLSLVDPPQGLYHFHLARLTLSLIGRTVFSLSVGGDSLFLNGASANSNLYQINY